MGAPRDTRGPQFRPPWCHVCHEKFGQCQLEIHFATIHSEILNETEKPDENKVEIL